MRVIMPSALMNESRESTCVTPLRSMRNRFTVQFPLEMACSKSVAQRVLANALEDVELRRAVALAQHRVCLSLKIRVEVV